MAWDIVFYDPPDLRDSPVLFLAQCSRSVRAKIDATLAAVAEAPPLQFAGGGQWEAMSGTMKGYHEVRRDGPGRELFGLFCILENPSDPAELARRGLPRPAIAAITGMRKPFRPQFSEWEYKRVRALGMAYLSDYPRRIVH